MNSLNIISARVSPQSSPAPSRTNSLAHVGFSVSSDTSGRTSSESSGGGNGGSSIVRGDRGPAPDASATQDADDGQRGGVDDSRGGDDGSGSYNETTPLLSSGDMKEATMRMSKWRALPKRIAVALIGSLRWVLSTIVSPGVYLVACLYDAEGRFAPIVQLKRLFGVHQRRAHKLAADYDASSIDEKEEFRLADSSAPHHHPPHRVPKITHTFHSSSSSTSGLSSESESDPEGASLGVGAGGRQGSRRRETLDSEEVSPSRKSIRIKLHGDDTLRQRKGTRKGQTAKPRASSSGSAVGGTEGGAGASGVSEADISAQLKSPTSPIAALTKYPKTPAPPRPLIPRRQPSYINDFSPPDPKNLKTLILDLDETLIHSMSKGGRIGSGHMVEVRLNTTWPGVGGQPILGPQHPILYYVHKRPHCDDFLRRVCKWYNLVVFTASVQEYADPVIDWLESERKFFSQRFYRQHCTYRHGAYIKDLSSVEPDLSKVMILDNSPMSYMFHQDNAIPIQGWINDPTDNDLLHLVPMLEGLQYASDVRALLALRGGEDGQHMAM